MSMRAIQQTVGELRAGASCSASASRTRRWWPGMRGHAYGKPVATMRTYLEAMERAPYLGPKPAQREPIVLAALRPNMLGSRRSAARRASLQRDARAHGARARDPRPGPDARARADGAARDRPAKARAIARKNLTVYLGLPELPEEPGAGSASTTPTSRAAAATGSSTRSSAWGDERRSRARPGALRRRRRPRLHPALPRRRGAGTGPAPARSARAAPAPKPKPPRARPTSLAPKARRSRRRAAKARPRRRRSPPERRR